MKTFKEMRQEAWKVATSRWSLRMLTAMFVFMTLGLAILVPLKQFFKTNDIQTWGEFGRSWQQAQMSGLDLAATSLRQMWSMTWASSFEQFLQMLLQALMVFGIITLALRAVRNQHEGWFRSAFGGFKAPLGMLWLNILMSAKIMLWALLFIVPGIIACFRYALAWYVKSEHPDYSASKCLAESGRLMKGHKWELFLFGLSYIWWILGIGVFGIVVGVLPFIAPLIMPVVFLYVMFVMVYIVFGQAVFYTEVKRLSELKETEADL